MVGFIGLGGILWEWHNTRDANARTVQANEKLWQSSYLAARYWTRSGGVGQRANALAIIKNAAAIRPSLELRNAAIAALLLPDVGSLISWKPETGFLHPWCYDADLEYYVPHVEHGRVTVNRASDGSIVADLGEAPNNSDTARFSPDGRRVAVLFGDGRLRVWDWRATNLLTEVSCARAAWDWAVRPYDFSPDSRTLIFANTSNGIDCVHLDTGSVETLLKTKKSSLVRVSPSGRWLAVARTNEIEIWDLPAGRLLMKTNISGPRFIGLSWHPHEELLAAGTDLSLFIWPWRSGKFTRLNGEAVYHFEPCFNPAGDLLFSGTEVWDVATRTRLLQFGSVPGIVAVSQDESRIACRKEKLGFGLDEFLPPVGLRKWVTTGDPRETVRTVDLHPNGRWLLAGGYDGWRLWDAELARPVASEPESAAHEPGVFTDVKFTRDGQSFYTCDDHGLREWPIVSDPVANHGFHIVIGEPKTWLAGLPAAGEVVAGRSVNSQTEPAAVECWGGNFSADGKSVALIGNGQAVLFDLESHQCLPFVQLRHPYDNIIALSPDGHWLAITHNNQHGGPDVYDLREGRHVRRLTEAELSGCVWNPQTGELITQSSVGAVCWLPGTWKIQRRLPWPEPGTGVGFIGFAPDGHTGWLNAPAGPQLYDLTKGEPYATLQFPKNLNGWAVTFDPARQRAYVAQANGIMVYDLAELRRELAHLGLNWPDDHPGEGFAPRQ